ncbi:MAG: FMN-binding protein [Firmicutes bacterium]|nr:FMN-binding protein [Bacillota bacterium]
MQLNRFLICTLIIFISTSITFCAKDRVLYKKGSYKGTGQGHHGKIKVKVITNKYKIKDIVITDQQEMPGLSDIVYEKIPKRVIDANSADVNVVSGASFTSKGLLEAIKEALSKAKINTKS